MSIAADLISGAFFLIFTQRKKSSERLLNMQMTYTGVMPVTGHLRFNFCISRLKYWRQG